MEEGKKSINTPPPRTKPQNTPSDNDTPNPPICIKIKLIAVLQWSGTDRKTMVLREKLWFKQNLYHLPKEQFNLEEDYYH